jgi:hypothetical protein
MPEGLRERTAFRRNAAGEVEWVFGDQSGIIEPGRS